MQKKSQTTKRILWFIALYLAGLITVGVVMFLLRHLVMLLK
jgi:hypothetical protein